MESERQRKIGALLQRDLADILQKAAKDSGISGLLISVTEVAVTVDLMIAKVYLSFFPEEKGDELFEGIRSNGPLIRHELANRTRNQMRRVPELLFFKDETAKKAEAIERSLKGEENPIEDRSLLDRRQKKVKTSIYIAWRYLLSKSNQSLVNLVSYLSLMVVVVAAAALTVVLSAFEGLKGLSTQYAYEHSPAIKITPLNQGVFTVDLESVQEWGKANEALVVSELSVVGLIQKEGKMAAGNLVAYHPTLSDSLEILYGTSSFSQGEMLLSLNAYYELGGEAYDSSLSVGSLIPGDRAIRLQLSANEIRQRTLKAKGVFLEDDESQVLGIASYEDLLYLGGLPKNSFTSLSIDETFLSKEEVASGLKGFIDGGIMVQDREDQNQSLFKLLNTEYWATYLIFSMVLILALFSLAGSIRLIMADKSSNFSTLKQMGLTSVQIKNIFLFLGIALSALGAFLGILLGLTLVIGQNLLGWVRLSSELSYPVSISLSNLFLVFITLLLFGFLAALISSRKLPEVSKAMRS